MSVRRWLLPVIGASMVLSAVLAGASPAQAVTSVDWNPGLIISDSVFYDSTSMTAADIQALFDKQGASCQNGAMPCLRDYKTNTPTMPADSYCKQAYAGANGETAATIIAKVGVACGINPQVLIAIMQKETSLVTSTAPSQWLYNQAMGYGCPDNSVCDPTYAAFFNQVYRAAWQFQVYKAKPAGTYSFYPGGPFNIQYNPSASCGSSPVTIQNWATASLYIYTPYQPNAAALANLYGTGDSCSAYGNRNFWTIFNGWFGPSVASVSITALSISGTPQVGSALTANLKGLDPTSASVAYQWLKAGVAISGATHSTYTPVAADVGASISVKATGSLSDYLSNSVTSAPVLVAAGVMKAATPTITGSPTVGKTLTAVPGAWSPSGVKLSYQWLRNGAAISGATSSKYTLAAVDGWQSVSVKVTGALAGYTSTSKTSAVVAVTVPTVRAGGTDRYDTAALVAQQGWTSSATVYLAYGQNFPDALAGVSLAAVNNAPILLTKTDAVPTATLDELKRLGAKNVVLLGGTSVISDGVKSQLQKAGYKVTRVSGDDRYATAAAIGAQVLSKSKSTTAVVANGNGFADALSISPVAGMKGYPVLFATATDLPTATADFIKAHGIKTVYVVGGTSVVGPGVVSALQKLGVTTVTRLAGVDRYGTSAAVATQFKSSFTAAVSVATGKGFADALTGGALSAKLKVPMLLLDPKSGAVASEQSYVKALPNLKVWVYGGTSALPDAAVKTLRG